jgi:hypothetical protein
VLPKPNYISYTGTTETTGTTGYTGTTGTTATTGTTVTGRGLFKNVSLLGRDADWVSSWSHTRSWYVSC